VRLSTKLQSSDREGRSVLWFASKDKTEKVGLYCGSHRKTSMVDIRIKKCSDCKDEALFGLSGKRAQYCGKHRTPGMVNVVLESKCCILDCEAEHDVVEDGLKYCLKHCPDEKFAINLKRLCKYCDIKEKSDYVCKDCRKISSKKEWAIIRYMRKTVDTKFDYNSSRMLQGCSKKRPDVYFDLDYHCVIVENDEHQHDTYTDDCECARIAEIVSGIGGRPVIIIRFNPDTIRTAGGKVFPLSVGDRLDLLVATIKESIMTVPETFSVKLIQLYFDDTTSSSADYLPRRDEDITSKVSLTFKSE